LKDLKLGKDFVITLHNDLIQARFIDSLTINEQKILFAVLSNIEPPRFIKDNDKREIQNRIEELEAFRVPIKEFTEWLGVSDPNYAAFKNIMKRLMKKLIEIQQPDGSWELFQWVTKASYIKKTGTAEIKISPELYPYLLNLDSNFTTVKLNTLLSFKSKYSTRLYQLLKKWSKLGNWNVNIDDLKMLLGVPIISEGNGVKVFKLDKYGHFKSRVLNSSIDEINELTELNITVEEIKTVRKVTALNFIIERKDTRNESQSKLTSPPTDDKKPNKPEPQKEEKIYGYELLAKYDYRDKGLFDKTTGEPVYVDDAERVQLIILNRSKVLTLDDNTCRLLEKELLKVVNHPAFDISNETHFIFHYVKSAIGIDSPAAFILSKTRVLAERLINGDTVQYKDLFKVTKKIELVPNWWFNTEQSGRKLAKEKIEQLQ
jgi:plasmid replication initiation protein